MDLVALHKLGRSGRRTLDRYYVVDTTMLSPDAFARSHRRHVTDVMRVALEGRGVLGFIEIHEHMTLLEARQLIWDNVEHAPSEFQFVLDDGVPVSARQENTQLILKFYPCVKIREATKVTNATHESQASTLSHSSAGSSHSTSEKLSVWTAAGDEFAVWVTEDYTFQQLRRDAARYWGLPPNQVALVDVDGCLWPEQAKILSVMNADALRERKLILENKGGGQPPASASASTSLLSTTRRRRSASLDSATTTRHTSLRDSLLPRHIPTTPLQQQPVDTPIGDLWRVFTFYCGAGDSLEVESLKNHQFTRLLRDANVLSATLTPAVAGIIYTAETKCQGKMTFDEFLNALLKVATTRQGKRTVDSDDVLLQRLVLDHILPRAPRWPSHAWDQQTLLLRTTGIVSLMARFLDPLVDLFHFYAKSHVLVQPTTHSAKQFYLAYADFQRFVNDFAFANLQISSVEAAQVYLAACASSPVHEALVMSSSITTESSEPSYHTADEEDTASCSSSVTSKESVASVFSRIATTVDGAVLYASAASQVGRCCMSLSAFLDALGRLGLVAFAKTRAAKPLQAVKAVYHHLSRGLGRSRVLEIVKNHGSTSIHAGRFYSGSVTFTHRFLDMWRYEGSPDYLADSGDIAAPILSPRQSQEQPLSPSRRLTSSAALSDERVVANAAGRGREALDRLVRNAFIRNATSTKADAVDPASPVSRGQFIGRTTSNTTTLAKSLSSQLEDLAEEDERALFESILVKGCVFKKYGQWGHPRRRFVWCSPGLDTVFWRPVDPKKAGGGKEKSSSVAVASLVAVLPGNAPKTRYAFMKHLSEDKALARCFSLVAEDKRVDLEADSETTRDLWVHAFVFVLKHYTLRPSVPS